MKPEDLETLARRVELADAGDAASMALVVDGLKQAFPAHARPISGFARNPDEAAGLLALIADAFHGWTIILKGKASHSDGSWTCSLRESSLLDDDELIGIGKAKTLPLALAAAALFAQSRRESLAAGD
jgi:hypothetical protein